MKRISKNFKKVCKKRVIVCFVFYPFIINIFAEIKISFFLLNIYSPSWNSFKLYIYSSTDRS